VLDGLGRLDGCVELDQHPPNQLRYLGDDGVSEGVESTSSHPDGNPIVPSTHERQGVPANSIDKPTCFPIRILR